MQDSRLETHSSFESALKEVRWLIDQASANEDDELAYGVLNRSALLFMASKFEVFIENLLSDFVSRINTLEIVSDKLSLETKWAATRDAFGEEMISWIKGSNIRAVQKLVNIGDLWAGTGRPSQLTIRTEFAYGKHGENEIQKLFEKTGISDIFEACDVFLDSGESLGPEGITKVDLRKEINSLVNIRNNILHQDATPQLTHGDVARRLLILSKCAIEMQNILQSQIDAYLDCEEKL